MKNIPHLKLCFIFALICVYIGCYVAYGGPAQLLPSVVLSSLDVPTEWDCKAECTRARDSFNFFCTALSFRSVPIQRNCILSHSLHIGSLAKAGLQRNMQRVTLNKMEQME